MDTFTNWVVANSDMLIATSAILCGIALMSMLMSRTARRREEDGTQG